MRVIAGKYKGHKLKAVPGRGTRPTTDKIKESMFNIIGPYLDGGRVLDLYAGSGALGLEALSRGADQAYFFERARPALQTIRENIAALSLEDQCQVFGGNNKTSLARLREKEPGLQFDWVFLDPPYQAHKLLDVLKTLQEEGWLGEGAVLVCEMDKEDELPDQLGRLEVFRNVCYGITRLICYRYI